MREMPIDIEQPLYSRQIIKAGDIRVEFFQNSLGQYGKDGELITLCDSNMQSPGHLHIGMFKIMKIRFRFTEVDNNVRQYLIENGYFIFRVVNKDYFTHPIHLMDNYFYFFEKSITPTTINSWENFSVHLYMVKPYDKDFKLTCELPGWLRWTS